MDNGIAQQKLGRPELSEFELEALFLKVTPYIQRGLSVKIACREANVPFSTVYKKMREVEWFRDKIESAQNFVEVLYKDIRLKQFMAIYKKVKDAIALTNEEYGFLDWLGEHDSSLSEMYGKHCHKCEEKKVKESEIPKTLSDPKSLMTILEGFEILRTQMIKEGHFKEGSKDLSS